MSSSLLPEALSGLSPILQLGVVLLASSIIYLTASAAVRQIQESKLSPTPPGPSGLPLIGNLLDVLKEVNIGAQHLLYEKWARIYGEVYKVKVGPTTQIMVNSDLAVKAIFDKPAAVSAERPRW